MWGFFYIIGDSKYPANNTIAKNDMRQAYAELLDNRRKGVLERITSDGRHKRMRLYLLLIRSFQLKLAHN